MNILIIGDKGIASEISAKVNSAGHTSFVIQKGKAAQQKLEMEAGVAFEAVIIADNDREALKEWAEYACNKLEGLNVPVLAISSNQRALHGLSSESNGLAKFNFQDVGGLLGELRRISDQGLQSKAA